MSGITLTQAQTELDNWIAADAAVASSQSYSIAGRSLSRVNASEIRANIDYWEAKVQMLTRKAAGHGRTRYVVHEE